MFCRKLPLRFQIMRLISLLFLSFPHFKRIPKGTPPLPPFLSIPPPSLSPFPYPSFPLTLQPLFNPFPLTLIPPHSPSPTALHHLPIAGLHSTLLPDGSSHLLRCPAFPPSPAAWYNLCPLPLSVFVGLMAHRSWVKCPSSLHALSLFDHHGMSSPCSSIQAHCSPSLGSVYHEVPPEQVLMNVIAGVGEGWLQDIPWEALPLTRSFVKERLALASFST